jgi:glyoxylase I family protein
MEPQIIGMDHIYVSVTALEASELYYDAVFVQILKFRKNRFALNGLPHIQYYNRQFGVVVRQSRQPKIPHNSEVAGLHHFCFRVETEAEVDGIAEQMRGLGLNVSIPGYHKEYAPDYYAIYFTDPDGIRYEVTNFRQERRDRMDRWDDL